MVAAKATPTDLALALCHEVGNLVGAVRLHTHLIDEDMSGRDLARVTLEVDDLCARSGVLLAHIRPLLAESEAPETVEPGELLASVRDVMLQQGVRQLRFDAEALTGLPAVRAHREVVHHLLQSLLFAALELSGAGGSVSLGAEADHDGVAFCVVDDGAVSESPAEWREQVPRGRPLLLAVADAILSRRGGELRVARDDDHTRVALVLPLRSDGG